MLKQLSVIAGPDKGKTFQLPEKGPMSIGRSEKTDTKLTDLRVSRNHCQVEVKDGNQAVLTDAKSALGTFVNDQRVTEHQLRPGDVIKIGDTQMRFEVQDVAEAETMADLRSLASGVLREGATPLAQLVGTTLGRFQIGQVLGRGETSVVFRAQDTVEDRTVALKVLQSQATRSEGEMQRLAKALQPIMALRHPNIVALYDLGKEQEHCWFALELIEGENLTQVIQRLGLAGMLDWQHSLRVAIHLARGLEYLHQNKVIHRNVLPSAVMINNSDKLAKLGDLMGAA